MKSFILKYKTQIIVLTILNLITNVFILINPLLLQYFIDTIIMDNEYTLFKYLLILLILSYMISIISLFFSNYYNEYFSVNIFHEKSSELISIVLSSSKYINTGDTMSRITDNLRLSISLITSVIPRIILNVFVIIIPLGVMFHINSTLTFVILLPILLFIVISYFIGNNVEKVEIELLNTNSELFSLFKEMFTSKEFIKSFGIVDLFLNKYDLKVNEYKKQILKYAKLNSLNFSFESIITGIPILILIMYGGYLIINKELTLGEFTLFMSYIYLLFSPVAELSSNWINYKKIIPAVNRINELYELKDSKVYNEILNVTTGKIVIKNLNFSYIPSKKILKDINLVFHQGMNYIIGENGSGKSTLLKLICRIYTPNDGNIFIDGQNIKDISTKSLNENIALIFPEPYLFEDTIYNNIVLNRNDVKKEDVIYITKKIKLDTFINSLPKGYNTHINENGVNLSSGEKQKIAMARILLKNPKIILLDEFANSIDKKSKKEMYDCLFEMSYNKTIIIIDHNFDNNMVNGNIMKL